MIENVEIKRIMSEGGVLWKKKSLGPGPTKLIGGNEEAGFYGECLASELITGDELARRIGLTRGLSQFSNEPWLKFSYMGKIEFIAKKPFRKLVSWDYIDSANAVFGNRVIEINGLKYKVRLPKGKSEGKQDEVGSFKGTINHGSEWNKLMLPIHIKAPDKWEYPDNVNSPTENWNVKYTDTDLFTYYSFGNETDYSWCQERAGDINSRLLRGYNDISSSNGNASDSFFYMWRPVLELVD